MVDPGKDAIEVRMLAVLCIFILCGILVAGLWPFHAPLNEVRWLKNANGLRFGHHGSVLGSLPFETSSPKSERSCSVEIWLRPERGYNSNTFLAFYSPKNKIQFALRSFEGNLRLQGASRNNDVGAGAYVSDVFRNGKFVFVAITSSAQGAAVYVDGTLAPTSAPFQFAAEDCTGQLVLGTSPVENDGWSGVLRGIAIYEQELTGAQISRHFETWKINDRPDLSPNERVRALYLFDEHAGQTVYDRSGSRNDLRIPQRYTIVDEKFLEPAWAEFGLNRSYWKNVGINIAGFVPLGFFFSAYLTVARRVSRPALVTVLIGATSSLTIEVLQAYLPTRDSGMTDLITNTLGTGIGVMLYRWKSRLFTNIFRRIHLDVFRRA